MRYKKYGAPIMATTIPAGTPDGCKMTFPNVSENTSKNAPTKIAIGKKS